MGRKLRGVGHLGGDRLIGLQILFRHGIAPGQAVGHEGGEQRRDRRGQDHEGPGAGDLGKAGGQARQQQTRDRPGDHQGTGHREVILRLGPVVGMGVGDGVDRLGRTAPDREDQDQPPDGGAGHLGGDAGADHHDQAGRDQDVAPVGSIRPGPEGQLHGDHAELHQEHQQGDIVFGVAFRRGKDRRETLHQHGQPADGKEADEADRRNAPDCPQRHRDGLGRRRGPKPCQADRQNGQRGEEDRDERALVALQGDELEQKRPDAEGHHIGHVENRDDLAAPLVFAGVVEPALGHDEQPGYGKAVDRPRQHPKHRLGSQRNQQGGQDHRRRQGREDPGMTGTSHQTSGQQTAAEPAAGHRRDDRAGHPGRKAGIGQFDRDEGEQQAIADGNQTHRTDDACDRKRRRRGLHFAHWMVPSNLDCGRFDEAAGRCPEARIEAFAALSVCPGLMQGESSPLRHGLTVAMSARDYDRSGKYTLTTSRAARPIPQRGVGPFVGRLGP